MKERGRCRGKRSRCQRLARCTDQGTLRLKHFRPRTISRRPPRSCSHPNSSSRAARSCSSPAGHCKKPATSPKRPNSPHPMRTSSTPPSAAGASAASEPRRCALRHPNPARSRDRSQRRRNTRRPLSPPTSPRQDPWCRAAERHPRARPPWHRGRRTRPSRRRSAPSAGNASSALRAELHALALPSSAPPSSVRRVDELPTEVLAILYLGGLPIQALEPLLNTQTPGQLNLESLEGAATSAASLGLAFARWTLPGEPG